MKPIDPNNIAAAQEISYRQSKMIELLMLVKDTEETHQYLESLRTSYMDSAWFARDKFKWLTN